MSSCAQTRKKPPSHLAAPLVSIAVNLCLFILKLVAGLLGSAPSLVSDAVHSLSDLLSTVVLLIGLRLSVMPPDKKHPYGHERFESLASLVLSGILFVTGLSIGLSALRTVLSGAYLTVEAPSIFTVTVAAISIGAKLALSFYMQTSAQKLRSTALRADALHQISDALASLGALVGIVLSILGFPLLEPLASVLIAGFLVCAAVTIFREAASGILDHSADDATEQCIRTALEETGCTVLSVTTRRFSSRVYAEITLLLDGSYSLSECDGIVSDARERLLASVPTLKGCAVTARPRGTGP